MWGIDVSHHQGIINWTEVKRHGVQYTIMKAMIEKSHQVDSRFEYNYYQSGLQELERGVYLYVIATDVQKAREEATDLLNILHGRTLERGIWLDLEDSKIRGLGKSLLNEIIQVESRVLNSQGYAVGIYSNLDWYLHVLDGANLIKNYSWWMARYPKNDDGTIKLVLQPSNDFRIWQYSSKGSVPGITGPVDMDIDIEDIGKTPEQVAQDTLQGKWGNGQQRINRLEAAGYDATLIQQLVNKLIHDRKYYPKYTGFSPRIDVVFSAIGVEPEYIGNKLNRLHIAKCNGIDNYTGTLAQNLKLISLARQGELKRY